PVHCRVSFRPLTVEEFKELDYRIMGHAFDCQNALGRLCDEAIYESDLADRLRRDGFRRVVCQLPLTVTHRDFVKTYYLDLVVDGALYELKTVSSLNTRHDAQLINYMLLLGRSCGKLLNFGSDRVEGQLVVSAVT